MSIEKGNAASVGSLRRGWFLGPFMQESHEALHAQDVELKWAHHAAGEERETWAEGSGCHSISILVRGRFVIAFENREVLLEKEGDFALWTGDERHTWRAEEDSTIITVRWREGAGENAPKG